MAELLVLPAVIAYGEAVVAYAGDLRGPGRAGRLATWGVRVGWVAQTLLLVAQAAASDGFPWATWAGALNLFVWLVVGVYLIWGCHPRYRLVGLVVMPLALGLLVLAWAGGGTGTDGDDAAGPLLAAHVGLILAALAAFTVAGAMSALYLWEDRHLKRHDTRVFRLRLPPLETLDRLSSRIVLTGLAALAVGIAAALPTLERSDVDGAMIVTLLASVYYATVLVLRHEAGLRGRRSAVLLVAGLALVAVVLPITHFAS